MKKLDLLERDFFIGGVFGFFHSGEDDFVLAEFSVDGIDGGVESGAFDSWVKEAWRDLFWFQEPGEDNSDLKRALEGAFLPHFKEKIGHGDAVLSRCERGLFTPALGHAFYIDAHVSSPESVGAQPGRGFVEKPEQDITAPFVGSEFGGEDVGVAEGFVGLVVVVPRLATEAMIEALANDSAECLPEFLLAGEDEVLSGEDSGGVEADLGSGVDSAKLGEFQVK